MTGDRSLGGRGVSRGSGVGPAHWLRPVTEPDPPPADGIDVESERTRFASAVDAARRQLARIERADPAGDNETAITEAQLGFLSSDSLRSKVASAIDRGMPAERAVWNVLGGQAAAFEDMDGPASRATIDLLDLRDRLVGILTDPAAVDVDDLPDGTVLLAERLRPTELVTTDPDRLVGIAVESAIHDTHAAIVARALGVPTVANVGPELRTVEEGARVAVDGSRGTVVVEPDVDGNPLPADGTSVPAPANSNSDVGAGSRVDVEAAIASVDDAATAGHADGIGLFRSEGLFFGRPTAPSEDEQHAAYRRLFEAVSGRVVVRTLDVGLDKVPSAYADRVPAERPLGLRGVRLSLGPLRDEFERQLRALMRAADESATPVTVLFPLVTTPAEVDRAVAIAEASAESVDGPVPVEFGAMVETPAAVFHADDLAERISLLSIGTSDLTQYVQCAGRNEGSVGDLYDPLAPAVLRAVNAVVERAGDDARIAVCGDALTDPEGAPLFAGMGVDAVVPTSAAVRDTRNALAANDPATADSLAARALDATDAEIVRSILATGSLK